MLLAAEKSECGKNQKIQDKYGTKLQYATEKMEEKI